VIWLAIKIFLDLWDKSKYSKKITWLQGILCPSWPMSDEWWVIQCGLLMMLPCQFLFFYEVLLKTKIQKKMSLKWFFPNWLTDVVFNQISRHVIHLWVLLVSNLFQQLIIFRVIFWPYMTPWYSYPHLMVHCMLLVNQQEKHNGPYRKVVFIVYRQSNLILIFILPRIPIYIHWWLFVFIITFSYFVSIILNREESMDGFTKSDQWKPWPMIVVWKT
jgi:hypothetical protein